VLEYSKTIGNLLGNPDSPPALMIEDPKTILKVREKPTSLRAAWELLEIFYVDKQLQSWLPERLVDWLAVMLFPFTISLFYLQQHFILTLPGRLSHSTYFDFRILTASCQRRTALCILNSAISRKSSLTCRLVSR